jgi:hypothetical protein
VNSAVTRDAPPPSCCPDGDIYSMGGVQAMDREDD